MKQRSSIVRRASSIVAWACILIVSATPQASASDPFTLEAGYDLFVTDPSTTSFAQIVEIVGVPLGTYNFGSGAVGVGATDTIVRRFDDATLASPVVTAEIVALSLSSVSPPDLYVTLQKDRTPADPLPPGPPSLGTLTITFDGPGGGTMSSAFNVCYDIRDGGFAGPIVFSGCDAISSSNVPWTHAGSAADPHCLTELGLLAKHGVLGPAIQIPGVNQDLNGANDTHDFNPGFQQGALQCQLPPSLHAVPTVSEIGLGVAVGLLGVLGVVTLRRRSA